MNDQDLASDLEMVSDEADTDLEEVEVTSVVKKEPADTSKKSRKIKAKRKRSQLTINLCGCKYDSVRRMARKFGIKPVGDEEDWTILWTDTTIMNERMSDMKRYQKINHFPGMIDICRKDQLARNLNRMKRQFPKEYNIFPMSWCLPADYGEFQSYFRSKKNKTYISKPESGCQGKGIYVFKNLKDIKEDEHCVVQQYISKPFIMDGFKFDLRIYVLVTACDPLRIFVYYDGLGRFATVKYHEPTGNNLSEQCMHLTNYAINKSSKDFIRDDDIGSKRKLTVVNKWFVDNGYDIRKIWNDIDDVIIKTLVSIHPKLKHNYRTCFPHHNKGSACFEILGFDILLDKKLKPWLMEVNHSPSFHTDAPLDKEVKEGLLYDTLNLVDLYANDKRKCIEEDRKRIKDRLLLKQKPKEGSPDEDIKMKYLARLEQFESTHSGGFRRIYPNGNEERYAKYFDQGTSLCAETAASKARNELSKQLRVEIEAKQRESDAMRKKLSGASRPLAGKKNDELRPESPTRSEKKKITFNPRRGYFKFTNNTHQFNCSPIIEEESTQTTSAQSTSIDETATNVLLLNLAIPGEINDSEEFERKEAMKRREKLLNELGITEQVAASLRYKPAAHIQQSTHKVTSLLTQPDNDDELEYECDTNTGASDLESPFKRRPIPLSADVHNYRSTKPYSESFCHTDPSYHSMGMQRSSSSQAVSRPSSKINYRHNDVGRQVPPLRPMYYYPTHPQSTLHRVLTTYGPPGVKSKGTSNGKSHARSIPSYPGYQPAQQSYSSGLGPDLVAVGLSVSSIPIRPAHRGIHHLPGKTWTRNMSINPVSKRPAPSSTATYMNHF